MKPGYKTSEFWIVLFINIISSAVAVGLVPTTGVYAQIAALIMMLATTYGYNAGRVSLKLQAATMSAMAKSASYSASPTITAPIAPQTPPSTPLDTPVENM